MEFRSFFRGVGDSGNRQVRRALVDGVPSGYVKIANWKIHPFFMGKSTISMVIFNSYVKLPEGSLMVLELLKSFKHWI